MAQDLKELARRLKAIEREFAKGGKVTDAVRGAFQASAQETFKKQADPYGKAWAPLQSVRKADAKAAAKKRAQGKAVKGQKILLKSGKLRRSVIGLMTSPASFVLQAVGYGAYLNYGTKNMPARSFFPRGTEGLPKSWLARASERAGNAFIMLAAGK